MTTLTSLDVTSLPAANDADDMHQYSVTWWCDNMTS